MKSKKKKISNCCANCIFPDRYDYLNDFFCRAQERIVLVEAHDCPNFKSAEEVSYVK